MKNIIVLIVVVWFVTSVISCKKGTVVDNDNATKTEPTISVTSPLNNSTVMDSVLITAITTNDSAIVKVEFYIDGNLVSTCSTTPWEYNWNVRSQTPNTTHTIQVKAYTKSNSILLSQLVNVNTQQTVAPTIYIATPTDGSTVKDSVLITTTTTNNSAIVKVEFYINDKFVSVCANMPWQYYWNLSDQTQNGTYKIQVKAITKTNTTVISQIVYVFSQNSMEFIYPLAVGATWKYQHYYTYHQTTYPFTPTTGVHTWIVVGKNLSNDTITYNMNCVIQDTTGIDVTNKTTPFTIRQTKYEISINTDIYSVTLDNTDYYFRVPRFVLVSNYTLGNEGGMYSSYVNNVGLVKYHYYPGSGMWTRIESLDLISFSK